MGSGSSGGTASRIGLDIHAVTGPLYHVEAVLRDSASGNDYRLMFEEALVADEYAVLTMVQDGSTGLKLYKNGVLMVPTTTTGSLASTTWLSGMASALNMDPHFGGGGFSYELESNALGMFMWWENPLTAAEVQQWYDSMQGLFNFFSTKSIRRNGRRLFSSNI
jgi:hypothetical protein